MISEKDRLKEWLERVADDISKLKSANISKDEKLKSIRENYDILSVLTKVANGRAFMVGVPPIINNSHK